MRDTHSITVFIGHAAQVGRINWLAEHDATIVGLRHVDIADIDIIDVLTSVVNFLCNIVAIVTITCSPL